ncbi:MAG: hypothetical protein IPH13_14850 [Planctomycetes bacterium]|nr:hypothetical protein [Planctomycetota bacterium]
MRLLAPILTSLLGVSAVLGAFAGNRSTVLFQASFDLSAQAPKAELGSFTSKGQNALTLVATSGGGYAAMFGAPGQEVFLQGLFAEGKSIATGGIDLTCSVLPKVKGHFEVGLITDEPTSAFYPASGSGVDGSLVVAGSPTGASLPSNVELEFALHLERTSLASNWAFELVVSWADAKAEGGTESVTLTGVLPNTALRKVLGVGFLKPAASNAIIQVDDILAVQSAQ